MQPWDKVFWEITKENNLQLRSTPWPLVAKEKVLATEKYLDGHGTLVLPEENQVLKNITYGESSRRTGELDIEKILPLKKDVRKNIKYGVGNKLVGELNVDNEEIIKNTEGWQGIRVLIKNKISTIAELTSKKNAIYSKKPEFKIYPPCVWFDIKIRPENTNILASFYSLELTVGVIDKSSVLLDKIANKIIKILTKGPILSENWDIRGGSVIECLDEVDNKEIKTRKIKIKLNARELK